MMPRVLFILKFREDYGHACYGDGLSSGLFNSSRFVVEMLERAGIEAKLVQVVDNNSIDREVFHYRPTHVIIEGLWVVPEKFSELVPLHPDVQWIVRIHSEIPFLALEGVALDWIARYVEFNDVTVAANSVRAHRDLSHYVILPRVRLLPNFYPRRHPWWRGEEHVGPTLRIGSFGAIRPLKNQLIQAMAAIEFAERIGRPLQFYINARDAEQGGDQVLKNIRALFSHTGHELIERRWMPHEDFLGIMDLLDAGMAVSFSESFCIVAADMVSAGVPVVVSPEVVWASRFAKADPTDLKDQVVKLGRVVDPLIGPVIGHYNRRGLDRYSDESREIWLRFLGG
jgi:hypothetical protein